jgi:hypothetical protein
MRSVLFAFRLRFRLWQNLLPAAAVAGFIPFVAVFGSADARDTRSFMALWLASAASVVTALVLGAATDRQERAFLLRLPIRMGSAWLGGLVADLFLAASVGVLVLLPSGVASWDLVGEVGRNLAHLTVLQALNLPTLAGFFVMYLVPNVPTTSALYRVHDALPFLQLLELLLGVWATARVAFLVLSDRSWRILAEIGAGLVCLAFVQLCSSVLPEVLGRAVLGVGGEILLLSALAAAAAHPCLGRLDARRGHHVLSTVLWAPPVLWALCALAFFGRQMLLGPGDLLVQSSVVSRDGRWVALTGEEDRLTGGLFNEAILAGIPGTDTAGRLRRMTDVHMFTFSEDGSHAAWELKLDDSTFESIDLGDPAARVSRCSPVTGQPFGFGPLMLDPSGERVVVGNNGVVRIVDTARCTVEASIALPEGRIEDVTPALDSVFHVVVSEKILGEEGAWRAYHVVDVDTRELTAVVRATITEAAGKDRGWAQLDDTAGRLLLKYREAKEIYDVASGVLLARVEADDPDRSPTVSFLPDGRFLIFFKPRRDAMSGTMARARVLDAQGAETGTIFDLDQGIFQSHVCALSPDRILTSVAQRIQPEKECWGRRCYTRRVLLLDLTRGSFEVLDDHSDLAWNTSNRVTNGPCWILQSDGALVEVTDGNPPKMRELRFRKRRTRRRAHRRALPALSARSSRSLRRAAHLSRG